MPLTVHTNAGAYTFNGPFTHTGSLADSSGVYVITTLVNGIHKVIDAGESHQIRSRIDSHDRKNQWPNHQVSGLYASAFYCDEQDRMALEGLVRITHQPPCGIR